MADRAVGMMVICDVRERVAMNSSIRRCAIPKPMPLFTVSPATLCFKISRIENTIVSDVPVCSCDQHEELLLRRHGFPRSRLGFRYSRDHCEEIMNGKSRINVKQRSGEKRNVQHKGWGGIRTKLNEQRQTLTTTVLTTGSRKKFGGGAPVGFAVASCPV